MQFRGFEFTEEEVESVTIRRNGTYVTIAKDDCLSNKVQGFARRPEPPLNVIQREDQDPRKARRG